MKRSYRCRFLCLNIPLLSIFGVLLSNLEAQAERELAPVSQINNQLEISLKDIYFRETVTIDSNDPFSFVTTGERQSQGIELDVTGEISGQPHKKLRIL